MALGVTVGMHTALLFKHIELKSPSFQVKLTFEKPERLDIRFKSSDQKQIVQTQLTGEEKRPEDSKFLSEKDQYFKEQTIAANTGSFNEAGQGEKRGSESPHNPLQQMDKQESKSDSQDKVAEEKKTKPGELSWSELSEMAQVSPENFKQDLSSLSPNLGVEGGIQGHTGLAQSSDFVEDIPLGDMTNLNTTEYKYYGFYHRIRQQLEQYWGNTLREKAEQIYAQGRRLPASENLITSLVIILDDRGQIVEINVKTPSGINEFDEAAIESFGKAGPFPNPPQGMIENGRAKIEWGFVVKG